MSKLVWIDLETGGLYTEIINGIRGSVHYPILEIAVVITDKNLEPLAEPYTTPIYYPWSKDCLKNEVSEWSWEQFKDTLIPKCLDLNTSRKLWHVETEVLQYLKENGVEKGQSPLFGNSIGLDRAFLQDQMPEVEKWLHYRNVDVSSFKEVFKIVHNFEHLKKNTHNALTDIQESIEELKNYLQYIKV